MEYFFSSDNDKCALNLISLCLFLNISLIFWLNKKYGFPLLSFKIEISLKHNLFLKPLPKALTNASLAENLLDKYEILLFFFLKLLISLGLQIRLINLFFLISFLKRLFSIISTPIPIIFFFI